MFVKSTKKDKQEVRVKSSFFFNIKKEGVKWKTY
nr:MAG TPA: hypothetical protein [Caudoviricetes sp.]